MNDNYSKLHGGVVDAVIAALQDEENELTPQDVRDYFVQATEGLHMTVSFCPNVPDFIELMELERG